jgi:hypothetical protein
MRRLQTVRWLLILGAGAAWPARPDDKSAVPPQTAVTAPAPAGDPVVARVNGEPIARSEVEAGMPKGGLFTAAFPRDLDALRQAKLERLLCAHALAQFLRAHEIKVTEAEIDAEVAQLRRTPPSAGCACCRYASLEEFMEALAIDMQELRRGIANDLGTQRYLEARWKKEYPGGEKRAALLQTGRARLEQDYLKASHIFFNAFQNQRFESDPDGVRRETRGKAEKAWRRLNAGEAFEAVASEVSEDAMSKPTGGTLGCIPREALGKQFAEAVLALEPGKYGRPVETPWGWHVIRREAMTDADLLDLLRADVVGRWWADERQQLLADARIERLGAE